MDVVGGVRFRGDLIEDALGGLGVVDFKHGECACGFEPDMSGGRLYEIE